MRYVPQPPFLALPQAETSEKRVEASSKDHLQALLEATDVIEKAAKFYSQRVKSALACGGKKTIADCQEVSTLYDVVRRDTGTARRVEQF